MQTAILITFGIGCLAIFDGWYMKKHPTATAFDVGLPTVVGVGLIALSFTVAFLYVICSMIVGD